MANAVPNSWKYSLWYPFIGDTFKMMLMQASFVFDKTADYTYALVSASEVASGNGYTTGGQALSNIALAIDAVESRAELTWDPVTWTASDGGIITSGAIIYNDSGNGAGIYAYTKPVISYKDAGGTITAVAGTQIVVSSVMETIEDI